MRFPTAFLSLCLASLLCGQEISVPERPADHVLDQTGKVTTEERREAAATLQPAAKNFSLDVYLVLLNSAAEEPPADVAQRLAQNWRGTADRAVVLTAPDLDPPILIEVAGQSLSGLPESDIKAMKAAALAEAGKAAPGFPAMLAAAGSVVSQVQSFRRGGPLVAGASGAIPEPEDASRPWMAWVAGGALICCLLALVLMRRGRGRSLVFPATEFRHRFSAPHSGGNDAMVSFGRKD
jgi:hypothetical protein